jgi:hypothetical protein
MRMSSQTYRVLAALESDKVFNWSSSAYQLSYALHIPAPSVRRAVSDLRLKGYVIELRNGAYVLKGE